MTNPSKCCVFVCTKQRALNDRKDCCYTCSVIEIYQAFLDEIKRRQLEHQVEVRRAGCLDRCEAGAVALVCEINGIEPLWLPTKIQKRMLPNKYWYVRLTVEDIPEIVENHFMHGQPLERKTSYV